MDPMTVDETTESSVEVEIFDQTYDLLGTDHDHIVKLAAYVDAEMRAMGERNPTADSERLAVLTALKIAEEYHLLETQLDEEESRESSPERLTEEERQRNRKRRQRHYTKRSYEKQLLALVNDESIPGSERREALYALGRSRGYQQRPRAKR